MNSSHRRPRRAIDELEGSSHEVKRLSEGTVQRFLGFLRGVRCRVLNELCVANCESISLRNDNSR